MRTRNVFQSQAWLELKFKQGRRQKERVIRLLRLGVLCSPVIRLGGAVLAIATVLTDVYFNLNSFWLFFVLTPSFAISSMVFFLGEDFLEEMLLEEEMAYLDFLDEWKGRGMKI